MSNTQFKLTGGSRIPAGLPARMDIIAALEADGVRKIVLLNGHGGNTDAMHAVLREHMDTTPPELIADLMEQGIALAGGASQLQGLAERLTQETKIRVYVADDPVTCVVRGAGQVVEHLDSLHKVLVSTQLRRAAR